jgi:hypothetical protein
MASTTQQDLIDDLLVDYLAALDLYQAAQARVSASLKRVRSLSNLLHTLPVLPLPSNAP